MSKLTFFVRFDKSVFISLLSVVFFWSINDSQMSDCSFSSIVDQKRAIISKLELLRSNIWIRDRWFLKKCWPISNSVYWPPTRLRRLTKESIPRILSHTKNILDRSDIDKLTDMNSMSVEVSVQNLHKDKPAFRNNEDSTCFYHHFKSFLSKVKSIGCN